jgi:uncharacterized protein with NRDE domain
MCIVAVKFDPAERQVELVFNREEKRVRPVTDPAFVNIEAHNRNCRCLVAGMDYGFLGETRYAGTWLGLNRRGLGIALTNRHDGPKYNAQCSRGLLVLNCLKYCVTPQEAVDYATQHGLEDHPFYNMLVFNIHEMRIVHNEFGNFNTRHLEPGIHVLSNLNLNDPNDQRVQYVLFQINREDFLESTKALFQSHEVLKDNKERGHGTVASTIIRLGEKNVDFHHAKVDENLVVSEYTDYSHLTLNYLL